MSHSDGWPEIGYSFGRCYTVACPGINHRQSNQCITGCISNNCQDYVSFDSTDSLAAESARGAQLGPGYLRVPAIPLRASDPPCSSFVSSWIPLCERLTEPTRLFSTQSIRQCTGLQFPNLPFSLSKWVKILSHKSIPRPENHTHRDFTDSSYSQRLDIGASGCL